MNDDFEPCYRCDCEGCADCLQVDEYFEGVVPAELACSCGSD